MGKDDERVLTLPGEVGLIEPYGLTVMGRMGADADSHRPTPAGPEVVGPAAPLRGAPVPGPAAPDDLTERGGSTVAMPGLQLSAGEG